MSDQAQLFRLGEVALIGAPDGSAVVSKLGEVALMGPPEDSAVITRLGMVILIDVSGSEPTPPHRRASVRGVRI